MRLSICPDRNSRERRGESGSDEGIPNKWRLGFDDGEEDEDEEEGNWDGSPGAAATSDQGMAEREKDGREGGVRGTEFQNRNKD